ncbi:lysophospholipid acyltransferase family protein [Rhodoferax antarcticus]|uniref:1-acylglycerol-3-phosphate O-acyltransferase n=1 Tax=Rhodoferax antarcticus ANT.BR TaxID=1111071 RepID=A0A1Q8YFI0_9BURK|nr:lysophospholipid acyltransferase family protein [Rhodoferax antarcticus]APW45661.1 1-acyl-sn-glycerol-3-phosphate acyltransferase [Rhodoferax antarcticus]MCW2310869.1 1-acyl-sn-glycerol-3-phosphate acyltransferase [Rhodoferax antarcticus]OLP06801.1 1-acylglycerol-3-phosphate O-acyltransferase [Rhodoferax antarcticus ANT.BR]
MAWIRSVLHMLWMTLTVIPWTLAVLAVSLVASRTTTWWVAVSWFRVAMWGTRVILGVRMEVLGLENLPLGKTSAAVLLSKHQSTLETLWLPTLMSHPLAFVFKRELLKVPFFGWSMARLDMIHIDRASRNVAMKHVIDQGRRLLAQGNWVIMFPEGTRIPRGEAGTYQTAGTRLAVESGAPVVPIAVATARCWPKRGFVKHAGVVRVSIGPMIESTGRDPKALMREAQAWIEAEMRCIDTEAYL